MAAPCRSRSRSSHRSLSSSCNSSDGLSSIHSVGKDEEEDLQTPFSGDVSRKPADADFLTRAAIACRGGLILDVGCGAHCQAALFFTSKCRAPLGPFCVTCIDIDAATTRSAFHKLPRSLSEIVCVDMTVLARSIRSAFFDLVMCFYALQHDPAPLQTLRSLVPLVRVGGIVAVAALVDGNPDTAADVGPLLAPFRHLYKSFLAPGSLETILVDAGCVLVGSWTRSHVYTEENEFPCAREYVIAKRRA